jgi:hypothetical protein
VFSGRSEFHFLPFIVREEIVRDIITSLIKIKEVIKGLAVVAVS